MIKHFSLRMRLTLLTALVMVMVAGVLTASSIDRAVSYYTPANMVVTLQKPTDITIATRIVNSPSQKAYDITAGDDELQTVPLTSVKLYDVIPQEIQMAEGVKTTEQTKEMAFYPLAAATLTGAAQKDFASTSMIQLLLVMFFGVGLTWVVAGRALKPVRLLAGAVEEIDAENLSARVPEGRSNDEIQQLTQGFNHMLEKLESAFVQQKILSAGAAHELKTPLAAIKSNIDVLEMDDTPSLEEYQETLAIVGRNTQRLIDLVNHLLELNDEQQVNLRERIDMAELLAELCAQQAMGIEAKQLQVTIHNDVPYCYGNRQLLASAVGNLLENAVKYVALGAHIALSVTAGDEEVRIIVWNDGSAIPADKLPHIFEPFYRVDGSRSAKIPGSGLGLSLVQHIIRKHGGAVTVQSNDQEGTTFTVILPQ